MDYERTYEVLEVEADGDGWTVTTYADSETGMIVQFEEISNGYAYEKVEGGFFEELHTTVTVSEVEDSPSADGGSASSPDGSAPDRTRVEFHSEFSFGGIFAPLIDRLATRQRRKELKRALYALGEEVDDAGLTDDGVVDAAD